MIVTLAKEHKFVLCCDFCAHTSKEVAVLIASPNGTHICNDCVEVCVQVILEKQAATEETPDGGKV